MLGVFGVVLQLLTLRTSKTAKPKLALVYPKHHSATQKGVAEVVARGKKTIPGRCFGVVFVWCGGVVVWCCGVVVLWCCGVGVVVLVWWCWCGGVGVVLVWCWWWCWYPPPCGHHRVNQFGTLCVMPPFAELLPAPVCSKSGATGSPASNRNHMPLADNIQERANQFGTLCVMPPFAQLLPALVCPKTKSSNQVN